MALRINTNVAAINAHRQLLGTEQRMGLNMEKLSSGYRINRASDDAAGLSVANRLRVEVRSLTVASRNVSEAKAMLNVAEGASNQIEGILERLKELATQSASDNAALDRDKINAEATALKAEINRIANDTKYQGTNLVTGTFGATSDWDGTTAVGVDADGINIGGASAGVHTFTADATGITLANAATGVSQFIATADIADGAQTLNFSAMGVTVTTNQDFVEGDFTLNADTVTVTAGDGVFQVGSGGTALQDTISVSLGDLTTAGLTLDALDLSDRTGAVAALGLVDNAIDAIGTTLGNMGAAMNRMDYTYNNLQISIENFSASQSVIRDLDMAAEMVSFTKNQILLQAGTAMLAQANMSSQGVLSLMG
jgi:flagellin